MFIRRALLSLLIIGIMAPVAPAATGLAVALGWDGSFRVGHWTPVFITVSDSTPRIAEVEIYSAHDDLHGMRVHQTLTLNPQPTTYAILIPAQSWGTELGVVLRDANTRRRLADWSLLDSSPSQRFDPVDQLVGVSGRSGADRMIERQFASEQVKTPWIDPLFLPAVARGYDALNVLILNQPDLARITPEQQDAILDWVRGGGQLICWLGEQPLPGSSAILESLPAMVGDVVNVIIPAQALQEAGLQERFRNLKGRALMPNPGAREIPFLKDTPSGWKRDLGLGAITLLPIDVSTLLFDTPEQSQQFWQPLIAGVLVLKKPENDSTNANQALLMRLQGSELQRRAEASNQAMNLLGDVPGAGQFGFSYVALVMVGMMLLVGPLDWIVLKKLGRQPWTWMTTTGWIALITFGAVYIGYIFKSGDLHYRTLRLIDQMDGMSVATVNVAGIYSPRTTDYRLAVDPQGWWEPLSGSNTYYSRGRMLTDIDFHQDYQGTRPDPMRINVWNLRFLKSDKLSPGPPLLEASLSRTARAQGRDYLVGTIKNIGTVALKGFCYRLANGRGIISADVLAPGATLQVDAPISRERPPAPTNRPNDYRYVRPPTVGPEVLFDLALDRSIQIERILGQSNAYVCLYAEIDSPPVDITLSPPANIERHQAYVRAVVPLEGTTP